MHRFDFPVSRHCPPYRTKGRLDTKTGKYVYGYAKHMRDALPGASFIGFTGTPIEKADANTQETFGGYVSIYDIEDAKEDTVTVPIYYESRLAKLDINRGEIRREGLRRQLFLCWLRRRHCGQTVFSILKTPPPPPAPRFPRCPRGRP